MNIKHAVSYVANKFKYIADKPVYIGDTWSVLPEINNTMSGDCDDFAITVLWLACDRSRLKFLVNVLLLHRYKLYHCKTFTGEPHIVGYAQGLWFDNFSLQALPKKEFFLLTAHKKYIFYPGIIIAWYLLLGFAVKLYKKL